VPIQTILPASGSYDETISLFCGRVDSRNAEGTHGLPEEQEDIRVVVKTLAEVEAMLDAGQVDNGHTVICLYWLLRHRDRLSKEWLSAPLSSSSRRRPGSTLQSLGR
jgi:ADP-ribose pyrophosphatase